jgi:hypothetical protein
MDDYTIIAWSMFAGSVAGYMYYVFRISNSSTSSDKEWNKLVNNLLLAFIASCLIIGFVMPCLNMSPAASKIPREKASFTRYDMLGVVLFGVGLLFLGSLQVYTSNVSTMRCIDESVFDQKSKEIDLKNDMDVPAKELAKAQLIITQKEMKEFVKSSPNFHLHYYLGQGLVFATLTIANLILVAKNT